MPTSPALALVAALAAQSLGPARTEGSVAENRPRSAPIPARPGTDKAAEALLRHLYAVYLALRACTEAGGELSRPEFTPTVPLDEARRTMRSVDIAAKEVGLDVDRLWADIGPLGLITAEAIKSDTPSNLDNCRRIGGIFRIDLGNLQNVLRELGSEHTLIEKDF